MINLSGRQFSILALAKDSSTDSISAVVLGDFPSFQFGHEPFETTGIYGTTKKQLVVEYLGEKGVALTSDSASPEKSVVDAIQCIAPRQFRISPPGPLNFPAIVDDKGIWVKQKVTVSINQRLANNADLRALVLHAAAFETAIGGVPLGILLEKRKIDSIAETYRQISDDLTIQEGMFIPFNDTDKKGILQIGTRTSESQFDCICFATELLNKRVSLIRQIEYEESGKTHELISQVGEVIAVD